MIKNPFLILFVLLAIESLVLYLANHSSWKKFFSIKNPMIDNGGGTMIENPVNAERLFIRHGLLYLDIVDGIGAGSGEGRLSRLRSRDGGKTWQRVRCMYFMPEEYYPKLSKQYGDTQYSDRSIATPFALKNTAECPYP